MATSKQIITHLKSLENLKNQEGMKRFAIGNGNTLGISMPVLRTLAKDYKKLSNRHEIALKLWKSNILFNKSVVNFSKYIRSNKKR
jgi:3-methyladenine DNA glycosylase AlkD